MLCLIVCVSYVVCMLFYVVLVGYVFCCYELLAVVEIRWWLGWCLGVIGLLFVVRVVDCWYTICFCL